MLGLRGCCFGSKNGITFLLLFAGIGALIFTGFIKNPLSRKSLKICTITPLENDPARFNQTEPKFKFSDELVPNIVHYLRIGKPGFDVVEATCILSVFHNHKPSKIIFHTDQKYFAGTHWENMLDTPGFDKLYEIQERSELKHVYGQEFKKKEHADHVARLHILRRWGGIFLSSDSFIVRSLDDFLHYEMTLASDSNLMVVAHRDARLLERWLHSYMEYDPEGSHRNGEIPPLFLHDELAVVLPLNVSGTVRMFPHTSEEFKKSIVVKLSKTKSDKIGNDETIQKVIQSVYPEVSNIL